VASLPALRDQFVAYVATQDGLNTTEVRSRLAHMIDYTCNGGKMTRGTTVVSTLRDSLAAKGLPIEKFVELAPQAIVLGWCIEILQAFFLVADDVMDHSETRRGQPCWYKVPTVGMDAVNDAIILESFLFFMLRAHFKNHTNATLAASYVPLFELFQDVSLQTQMGQMLDLLSQPQGAKGPELLPKFTLDRYSVCLHNFFASSLI
jgi:farnesyl diphosphate synthase